MRRRRSDHDIAMFDAVWADGTDQRNGVSFDQQDGSAVGGFQGRT
jgi:hypothetical protein